MNATIQKWGNSLALRIPKLFALQAHLEQGILVDVSVVEGKIIVDAKRRRKRSLSQLLKGVTKDNLHSEVDWGKPMGREVW